MVKFPDKERHQLFLEPEGYSTYELYLNGFSTSLPADLQKELVCRIPGFEHVAVLRPGYAIEYDMVDPTELWPSLETKRIKGLFNAGQVNGTTGYEEAGAQGIVAGINAARYVHCQEPMVIKRDEGYIGILIDDLITQGVDEPYRMFTSRAEQRLKLRIDNADERLTEIGYRLGMLRQDRYQEFVDKSARKNQLQEFFRATTISGKSDGYSQFSLESGVSLAEAVNLGQLAKRPEVLPAHLANLLPQPLREKISLEELTSVVTDFKYHGYLASQENLVARMAKATERSIPQTIVYSQLPGLSNEMVERLNRVKPQTIGQAMRIPGITPAALSLLTIHIELMSRQQ